MRQGWALEIEYDADCDGFQGDEDGEDGILDRGYEHLVPVLLTRKYMR